MKIKDLKEPYMSMAMYEQDNQLLPMEMDDNLKSAFLFKNSIAGTKFWKKALNKKLPRIGRKIIRDFKRYRNYSEFYEVIDYVGIIGKNWNNFLDFQSQYAFEPGNLKSVRERIYFFNCKFYWMYMRNIIYSTI